MKDLNLLRVFEAMWSLRSVSKASERLGISQPAVSNALGRLRKEYNDPLFTRTGTQMSPTAFCSAQAHYLLDALKLVHRSQSDVDRFDARVSSRVFVLGMRDIGEATLLPSLIAHCADAAPKLKFQTLLSPLETSAEKLADGRVDMAIGFLPSLESGIHRRKLFDQHYVCAARAEHPIFLSRVGLSEIKRHDHIAIEYSGTGHALVERRLREQGLQRPIKLQTSHYLSVGPILAVTELICLLPEMLAQSLSQHYPIAYRPIRMKDLHFPISLYWHERFHRDPGNKWLRSIFSHLFGQP
jgi:DNA-binding transcriptional LysR family regulator